MSDQNRLRALATQLQTGRNAIYERFLEPTSERANALARMLGGVVPPQPRENIGNFLAMMVPRPQDMLEGSGQMMRGAFDADPNAALGGLSLMAMGAMDAVPGGRATGQIGKTFSKASKEGRSYADVPDALLGFRRSGQNKPGNYKFSQWVKITLPNGDVFFDAISGLNKQHAIERAVRNWEGSIIEPISKDALPSDWISR